MSKPSCIRYSYAVQKILKCSCSAYSFPHNLGCGECSQSVVGNTPVFSPPKRGLASKIEKLLILLEEVEDDTVKEILQDFNLSVGRNRLRE